MEVIFNSQNEKHIATHYIYIDTKNIVCMTVFIVSIATLQRSLERLYYSMQFGAN